MIDGLKNFFNSKFTPTEKDFEGKGMLSPAQFVQAGDQLAANFGWKWQSSVGKASKHLPAEKQYLTAPATSMTRIGRLVAQQIVEKSGNEYGFVEIEGDEGLEEREEDIRKYSMYISYDDYYYTPRLWIKGNAFNGAPLTSKQIF